jgi:hypothetical protein
MLCLPVGLTPYQSHDIPMLYLALTHYQGTTSHCSCLPVALMPKPWPSLPYGLEFPTALLVSDIAPQGQKLDGYPTGQLLLWVRCSEVKTHLVVLLTATFVGDAALMSKHISLSY